MSHAAGELNRLVESLQALALPATEQTALFPAFVHVPDELALTFEYSMRLMEQSAEFETLTALQRSTLGELDRRLAELSGQQNAAFWTVEALRQDPRWEELRTLARRILQSLGHQAETPKLAWAQYVQTSPEHKKRRKSDSKDTTGPCEP